MLPKSVYACEYMGDWEKFHETSLPTKEDFDSSLNMKDITDLDDMPTKIAYKDFITKNCVNIMNYTCKVIYVCYLMCL